MSHHFLIDDECMVTPEEFAEKMRKIVENHGMGEDGLIEAGMLMSEILSSVGYESGMKVFHEALGQGDT